MMKIELNSPEEIKIASDLVLQNEDLLPSERYLLAKTIQLRARSMGVEIPEGITKLANLSEKRRTSDLYNRILERGKFVDKKKVADLLQKVAREKKAIDKIEKIEHFDMENGLNHYWNKGISDPVETVLRTPVKKEPAVKVASATIKVAYLKSKEDKLRHYFKNSFVDELLSDPERALSKLQPETQKLLYGIVNE